MKVTFQTQDLCRALERVQRAAQTKVTSNTNNGFFISAEDGKVEFQANDYSIGIRTFCEADVEERGSVLISAPHLLSTIKMIKSSISQSSLCSSIMLGYQVPLLNKDHKAQHI